MEKEIKEILENYDQLLESIDGDYRGEKKQGRKKVLLVDDSAIMLRSMKSMLDRHYDICLAKSGEQALKVILREQPDLVLLDYEMEGMDGKETFEAMKKDAYMSTIPVVFLTSVSDRKTIYSVLKTEPDGYLLKPPDEKRILETIEETLTNKTNK